LKHEIIERYKKNTCKQKTYAVFVYLFSEYPAFQDFLLINEFPKLAVKIAETDSESYVRASALAFVAATVRINKLWEQQLSELNLNVYLSSAYLFE